MAAKSVLKSSVSAVLAAVLSAGLLLPAAASAQEDRGEGGMRRRERMERMEQRGMSAPAPTRSAPPAMPTMSRQMDRPAPSAAPAPQRQAQAWQGQQGQGQQGQGQQWQGRGQASNAPQGWSGNRPDRGPRVDGQNGGQMAGQPGFGRGRPAWQQGNRGGGNGGGGFGQPGGAGAPPAYVANGNPVPGARNPTYVDPRRNATSGTQPGWNQNGNGNWNRAGDQGRDRDRDRPGNRAWNRDGNRDGNRDWNRGDRDGNRNWANGADRDRNWNRDRDRNWNRNGDWNRGREWNRGRDWNRNGYAWNQWGGNGWNGNRGWNGNGNWGNRWDRNGWRRDNRYNWLGWRNSHRDFFRGGFYSAPFGGFNYSRLSIGVFLGNAFFDQRYWIADPYAYHLPPAYQPYQWVRYYNDVVLVDTFTGEVVDVVHDFFW